MNDEDWHMYKQMDRDYKEEVEEDVDEDEAKLSRLTSRLKEIDFSYTSVPPPGLQIIMPEFVIQQPLTEKDYQIGLGVERFRDRLPALDGQCRSGRSGRNGIHCYEESARLTRQPSYGWDNSTHRKLQMYLFIKSQLSSSLYTLGD
ncbi:hypothetical protein SELMODRAFT_414398 [Selaginella moellendorffii]|uniref:Uncharacterized protein n=1 Tax=Selaginella moellendorffii TaxID=88036 RepID=D8RSM3_SELML|nr:hypothetical protein SELMODRAFT_414398 [Selaginella moellendorffii]